MTGCIIDDHEHVFVWVLSLELGQKDMHGTAIHTVDTHEVKALSCEWGNRTEEVPILEGVPVWKYCSLTHLRPTSAYVREKTVAHFVLKIQHALFPYVRMHAGYEAPFLNAS